MKPLGRWLAETRLGRWAFRAVMLSVLGLAAAGLIWFEVGQRTRPIIERIEIIERVEPIDLLRECLRTPECRRLFRHPEFLRPEHAERGDAAQPPSTGGQPPEPGVRPGGREGSDGEGPSRPRRPKAPAESPSPDTTPTSPPAPSPSSAPPAEAPGKPDETPAAEKEQGAQACVEVVLSACVGVPPLLR